MKLFVGLAVALATGCSLCAGKATAADVISASAPAESPMDVGWTLSVTPYVWAAGLSGETAQFGLRAIDIDTSFREVLDNLDVAAMVIGEARSGPYSVFGDLIYTKLSAGSATPRGILATNVDVEAETFAGLLGAGYSVVDTSTGRLDIMGGVRVWSVDTDISFSGAFLDGRTRSDGATWIDGLVGVRGNLALTPRIYAMGWAFVGSGQADLDWDVAGGLGYRINDTVSATLGYRALGVDYSDDGFLFDVVQQGPIMGLTIRF